ncbi:hypothetical protein [Flavobacterium poyangense]|uniref:hypothetical protein n=1 Tax=Flavobacterium poyangense TaxID=2204302 RepID=UPI0014247C4C|nr:hypothetical protein [Flavobacterium sp. JXAS1]
MDIKTLNRIKDFRHEVEDLPNEIYTNEEFTSYNNETSKEEKDKIVDLQFKRLEETQKIKRKLLGFFAVHLEDNSNYYSLLGKINFRPKEGLWNSFHYRNNEAWLEDKNKFLILLELIENEFTEKLALPKSHTPNPFQEKDIFSSALFWTILTISCGLSYFFGLYKAEYDKTKIENELNQQKTTNINQAKEIEMLKLNSTLKKEK